MDTIIGLEIHVQLSTKTKLFCSCRADYFAAPPNTLTCPVCLGLPGALPVLNKTAVTLGLRAALALGASVNAKSLFDRKNYFYPDLPKGYQITQREVTLAAGGSLLFQSGGESKTIRIRELHLEEDAGKLIHTEEGTYIDFNRCGVPLLEIVTEPDLRSPQQARDFLRTLRTLLRHLGVSNADMEKGELRCDANLSLGKGEALGTKTEIKNLNSFKAVEQALAAAAAYQRELSAKGEEIAQVTFGWNEERGELLLQRTKEEAQDYRYFPDPDLVPLVVTGDLLAQVRAELPELPWERSARWLREFGITEQEAEAILWDPERTQYYEEVVRALGNGKVAASWVLAELGQYWTGEKPPVPPQDLATLALKVEKAEITRTMAREILARAVREGTAIPELLRSADLTVVSDESALRSIAQEVVASNPQAVSDFRAGKGQALGFLVGQAMKKAQGRADPKRLAQILQELLRR